MIQEKIIRRDGKFFVVSSDGKKNLGGPFDSKEDATKRLAQVENFKKESIVWEAQDFKYEVIERQDKQRAVRISGVALETGLSKNKVNYRFKNLEENDGKEFNFIVAHRVDYDNPDHNVGDGSYSMSGNQLRYKGIVENTTQHPNIVEQIEKGRVSVSIHGGYESHKHKDNEVIIEGLSIPLLALVNKHARGVPAATIEAAIAERLEMDIEEKEDKEDVKMAEDFAKVIKEKDDKISELNEVHEKTKKDNEALKKKLKEQEDAKKAKVVESLLKINKELDKNELMEKDLSVLETMEGYEKKIKEVDGEDAGDAEVEGDGDKVKETDEFKNIVVNKEDGTISMSEAMRKKFNDDLMNSIYR